MIDKFFFLYRITKNKNELEGGKIKNIIIYSIFLSFLFLAACKGENDNEKVVTSGKDITFKKVEPIKADDTVPNFKIIKVADEKTLALSDYDGKVVIIDFWATWCPPCKVAIPSMNKLYDAYNGQGLEVIGITVDSIRGDSDKDKLKQFIEKFAMKYPIAYASNEVRAIFGGIPSIPTVFILSKEKKVIKSYAGFSAAVEKEIEETVKQLIAQ